MDLVAWGCVLMYMVVVSVVKHAYKDIVTQFSEVTGLRKRRS